MPTLPARPSLEHLKKQAKRLHKSVRADDVDALTMVGPYFGDPTKISLQQAQLVVARDYGFSSWTKLKRHVESDWPEGSKTEQLANYFLDLVCLHYGPDIERSARNFEEAAKVLESHPEIERHSVHTAAAIGNLDLLHELLSDDPTAVDQKGGPFGWTPLMYAAYARLPGVSTFAAGKILLEAGADPNAHYLWGGSYRFSVLTGIFGDGERGKVRLPEHPDMVAFARAVLDKGANPNECQGAYNRCFSSDDTHLELMLEYGLKDSDPSDWWLLDNNPKPEDHRTMHFQLIIALRKGFAERARLLIEHGVDLNKTDANYYQTPPISFTPYQVALMHGLPEIAALIRAKGGNSEPLNAYAQFQAACMAGDLEAAEALAAASFGNEPQKDAELLLSTAENGNLDAVKVMVALGFDLNPRHARTPLHAAAWRDQGEVIKLLLASGADPKSRDPNHFSPPLAHALYAQSQTAIDLLMVSEMDVFMAAAMGKISQIEARLTEDQTWLNATLSRVLPDDDGTQEQDWKTPLWFAAMNGQNAAVRFLLEQGAGTDLKDASGETLAACVKREGYVETARLLEEYDA